MTTKASPTPKTKRNEPTAIPVLLENAAILDNRAAPNPNNRPIYHIHPSMAMVQTSLAKLAANTGKTFEQWAQLVLDQGPASDNDRREWLKTQHGVGTNMAWWIVQKANGEDDDFDPDSYLQAAPGYIDAMYAGPKAKLRPLHDALDALIRTMGQDVKVCPCKTIVPFYRKHVFAQIKPTTQTRIDLGFALKDLPVQGRLIDTGGFAKKDRITHRIPLSNLNDINDEVHHWLRQAYLLD